MLSGSTKLTFAKLFNDKGSVFDLSIREFDNFTEQFISIRLTEYYGTSKGRSLERFINEWKNEEDIVKVIKGLLEYAHNMGIFDDNLYNYYKGILNQKSDENLISLRDYEFLMGNFHNEEILSQLNVMNDSKNNDFLDKIDKSKSFIESTCKTILMNNEHVCEKIDITKLIEKTFDFLKINKFKKEDNTFSEIMKKFISGFKTLISAISEMRNKYGNSHGKADNFVNPISVCEAELCVRTTIALAIYMIETYSNND